LFGVRDHLSPEDAERAAAGQVEPVCALQPVGDQGGLKHIGGRDHLPLLRDPSTGVALDALQVDVALVDRPEQREERPACPLSEGRVEMLFEHVDEPLASPQLETPRL